MMAMIGVFGHKSLVSKSVQDLLPLAPTHLVHLQLTQASVFLVFVDLVVSGVLQHLSVPEDKISVSIMIV